MPNRLEMTAFMKSERPHNHVALLASRSQMLLPGVESVEPTMCYIARSVHFSQRQIDGHLVVARREYLWQV
eukprot:SAG11_NODE_13341_length_659_cov_1.019643_2_plen_70_part_01